MQKITLRFLMSIVTIYLMSLAFDSIVIEKSLALLWLALVLVIVGLILRPIMMLVLLPFSIITFGIFVVVINALIIMIADWMTPNIWIGGFINAFIIALIMMFIGGSQMQKEPRTK